MFSNGCGKVNWTTSSDLAEVTELILAQYTWKAKGQSEIVVEQRNLSNALPRGLNTKILVFPSSVIKCSNLLREN